MEVVETFKEDVYKLAEHVGLPNEFIEKALRGTLSRPNR